MLVLYIVIVVSVGTVLSNLLSVSSSPVVNESCFNLTTPQGATAFAIQYGTPLAAYTDFAVPILKTNGSNILVHNHQFADATSRSVVLPNVDTLYSTVVIDLSQQDLVVTIPQIEDRYFVFPFYDFYGNNYANLGSTADTPPGDYLVRYIEGAQTPGLNLTVEDDNYVGRIYAPTPYGALLVRIIVHNASDVTTVNQIQDTIGLRPISSPGGGDSAPPLSIPLLTANLSDSQPIKSLQLLARTAFYNPPEVRSDLLRVNETLRLAGIYPNGTYETPSSVNLTAAVAAVKDSLAAVELPGSGFTIDLGNKWQTFAPNVSGNFLMNYNVRADVAIHGYLQLTSDEAVYPMSVINSSHTFSLNADQSLIFTFLSLPPIMPLGFWSLTAYGPDDFLIPNDLNRYSVGDRSNIAFSDGTPVYGPGSSGRDGEFQILVQPADVPPPSNWTNNWLPAPAGGGNFSLTLRWYAPTAAFTNGTYKYPTVTLQSTLSDSSSSGSSGGLKMLSQADLTTDGHDQRTFTT